MIPSTPDEELQSKQTAPNSLPSPRTTNSKLLLIGLLFVALLSGGYIGYDLWQSAQSGIPDLDLPYHAPASLPEDIRTQMEADYASAVDELKADPSLKSRWLALGVFRKNADDFKGAEEIWQYVTVHWPDDVTAYSNLADLYQFYSKDYEKAEDMLKQVLSVEPAYLPAYKSLHEIYRYHTEDGGEQAESILKDGIAKNPLAVDLMLTLALYYKDEGHTTDAREMFQSARAVAVEHHVDSVVLTIDRELSDLAP